MADPALDDEKRIRDEAAQWYARLNRTPVSTETIRQFREWRRADQRHEVAYVDIEEFWRRAGKLDRDVEIQRAAGEALAKKKSPLPQPSGRGLALGALAVAVAVGVGFGWRFVIGEPYGTAVGEQRYLRLADGTGLRLDTDTRVRVKLGDRERRVELAHGRAFFDVAHDPARPFLVKADGAEVRALGTRFDVRRDGSDVRVTLVQGRVRVVETATGQAHAWTLSPGDQVAVGAAGARPAVRRVDPQAVTSWTSGRLVFQSVPLSAAVAEVNRYSERKIVVDDAAVAERPVSGVFDAGDTDAFVTAVQEVFGLRAEVEGGREIRLKPAA